MYLMRVQRADCEFISSCTVQVSLGNLGPVQYKNAILPV